MAFTPTHEQEPIIASKAKKLVVRAYAGTGKTSTLVAFARANPSEQMLYLAYNRAIRDEATKKFPRNVTCKTTHQIAFTGYGKTLQHKLKGNLRPVEVARDYECNYQVAAAAIATVSCFMNSADQFITQAHYYRAQDMKSKKSKKKDDPRLASAAIKVAEALWNEMQDSYSKQIAVHDVYLKQYQLSRPDLSAQYSVILFDEGQDSNELTTDIVFSQTKARVITVGDEHQQIYQFRGAIDALSHPQLHDAEQLRLTNSFRFGPNVAAMANVLLRYKGEDVPLVGLGGEDRIVVSSEFKLSDSKPPFAFIARTVMGVIEAALFFSSRGMSIELVGGYDAYDFKGILDVYWLSKDEPQNIQNKRLLEDYPDYTAYQIVAQEARDVEMLRAIKVVDSYPNLPDSLAILKSQLVKGGQQAQTVITTAHKSKGLEWDQVYLCDDFPDLTDDEIPMQEMLGEVNLQYVALTRAKKLLVITPTLLNLVKLVKTGFRLTDLYRSKSLSA
ncbi:UvrD-helicase domain-containing protein [Pseudomonas luteola]|uniref:UvrD-helicase domain-containing protein n=1 Tax=Pseudomonas luteola TaxID=47886 RepID=UPI001239D018|nr:UvrD-helicase domain-containing protein [Pseudomonas luteola]QEU26297.1 ATP-dependent helicase [Pseudomonas luteola]